MIDLYSYIHRTSTIYYCFSDGTTCMLAYTEYTLSSGGYIYTGYYVCTIILYFDGLINSAAQRECRKAPRSWTWAGHVWFFGLTFDLCGTILRVWFSGVRYLESILH